MYSLVFRKLERRIEQSQSLIPGSSSWYPLGIVIKVELTDLGGWGEVGWATGKFKDSYEDWANKGSAVFL